MSSGVVNHGSNGISELLTKYFVYEGNPSDNTHNQLGKWRDTVGLVGLIGLGIGGGTALYSNNFSPTSFPGLSIIISLSCLASYSTRKIGYVAAIGIGAALLTGYGFVDAVRSGRFYVKFDIAETIRAVSEALQRKEPNRRIETRYS